MPVISGIYIWFIAACGATAAMWAIANWHTQDAIRFAAYFVLAAFASGFKVHLKRVTGTLSGGFFVILLAAVDLTLSEALLIGIAAMLIQVTWHSSKRVELRHAAFNVGNAAISALSGYWAYHASSTGDAASRPLMIAAAALTYFLVNTWLVTIVIALTERKAPLQTWRQYYLFSLPSYLLAAALVSAYVYAAALFGWQLAILFIPATYAIYDGYRVYVERVEQERQHEAERRIHAEQISTLHLRTIEALASAIEAKDHTTHAHLRRVQVFATAIGEELGLTGREIEALRAAAVLHDIGKIAVPEYIVTKPGRLTPLEFDKMKMHPIVGADMVDRIRFPYPVAPIVRSHHEKWDGTGYPDGLTGEEIPIGARILAAVDCLDALATDRQYRLAMPLDQAMTIVASEAGRAFDPRIVAILQRRYVELEARSREAQQEPEDWSEPVAQARALETARPAAGFQRAAGHRLGATVPHDRLFESRARTLVSAVRQAVDFGSPAQALESGTAEIRQSIAADAAVVYGVRDGFLTPLHAAGQNRSSLLQARIASGTGLCGWVAAYAEPIMNGNPAVDKEGAGLAPLDFHAALACPVRRCGTVKGVVVLYRIEPDSFDMAELALLEAVAADLYPSVAALVDSAETSETHLPVHAAAALSSCTVVKQVSR
jgi:putative nucleotidyltransferase with HDIG domain